MRSNGAATLLGVLIVFAVSSCGVPSSPAPRADDVVIGDSQFPDTLNPFYALRTVDYTAAQLSFTPLFRTRADFTKEPVLLAEVPELANGGVRVSEGGMDVRWRFREGMRWSDGSAIGCDDLIATWHWVTDPANTGLAAGLSGWDLVSGIDGAGATSCSMHFRKPYGGYLSFITSLLPASYLAKAGAVDAHAALYPLAYPQGGVYSGPYVPTRVTADQIEFGANPYWRTISGHDPVVSDVTFKSFGTATALVTAFRAGEVDLALDLSDADEALVAPVDPAEVAARPSLSYELLSLNDAAFKRRFGDDATTIKRAIALAVDRPEIVDRILHRAVVAISNFVPRQAWYYRDEGAPTAGDPAAAASLLEAAGWTAGGDGIRTKGGARLSVTMCTNPSQVRIDTLTLVASALKHIGIDATIRAEPSASIGAGWAEAADDTPCNLARGTFDIAEFAFTSPADPFYAYATFHSSAIPDSNPRHAGFNVSRTSIPEMDAALDTVSSSVDPDAVRAAMATVQDLYVRDVVEIPLYARTETVLVSSKLKGVEPADRWDGAVWNIGNWMTAD